MRISYVHLAPNVKNILAIPGTLSFTHNYICPHCSSECNSGRWSWVPVSEKFKPHFIISKIAEICTWIDDGAAKLQSNKDGAIIVAYNVPFKIKSKDDEIPIAMWKHPSLEVDTQKNLIVPKEFYQFFPERTKF